MGEVLAMSRLLVLALVSGCASLASSTETSTTHLEDWLDNWVTARNCLVDNAGDTRVGLAMSSLQGRDCASSLQKLELEVEDPGGSTVKEFARLSRTIAEAESLSERASAVDALDAAASAVGALRGHPIARRSSTRELLTLPQPWIPFENGERYAQSFNAGFAHTISSDHYTVLESFGKATVSWFAKAERLALPSRDVTVSRHAWLAAAVGDDLVVVMRPDSGAKHAYVLESSHDRGRHWKREPMFVGGSFVRGWQDPRTGEIVLSLQKGETSYVQQLTAAGAGPLIETETADQLQDRTCVRDGHVWSLNGESLVSVKAGKRMMLTGWANEPDLDCRGDAAYVLRHAPDVIERCTSTCTRSFEAPSKSLRGVIGVLDDGRWIYAATLSRVIAVWVEGAGTPRFWRLPTFEHDESKTLMSISVLAGKPALVLGTPPDDNGTHLIALPVE